MAQKKYYFAADLGATSGRTILGSIEGGRLSTEVLTRFPNKLIQTGGHFVIIVGGNSTDGYHYYDPATSSTEKGTSINNQFTSDGDKLYDSSTCIGKEYIVTGIRKNQ